MLRPSLLDVTYVAAGFSPPSPCLFVATLCDFKSYAKILPLKLHTPTSLPLAGVRLAGWPLNYPDPHSVALSFARP